LARLGVYPRGSKERSTMTKVPALTREQIEALQALDSATVSNAVESFQVRLPNTGYADSSIRCLSTDFPPMVGYAATARIRTAAPSMEGQPYMDRQDWLNHVLEIPEPRVVVLEDLDNPPGRGALIGDMHVNILRALGCVGVVTNGAVRGLPSSREVGLQLFAGSVSVSHAYAHVIDFGGPVVVGRMKVQPGDILHGDLHGVQTVPLEVAADVPKAARHIVAYKHRVIELCRSGKFTLEEFGMFKGTPEGRKP
jgi:4-hydroxy-4-methyl-2-oxoglutarate aldolase